MLRHSPIRIAIQALLLLIPMAVLAQPAPKPGPHPSNLGSRGGQGAKQRQPHLAQWMQNHSNLTPEQQQKALALEPGFKNMRPEQQQAALNRLAQLNAMPPAQRERVLARTEAMEQLNPEQRQQVRSAMSQLSALPVDRRRAVARTFRDIREMPVSQREAYMNSEWYRGEFNEKERSALSNLVTVEPWLPLTAATGHPAAPQR